MTPTRSSAEQRAKYHGMSVEDMAASMDDSELERNVRRGGAAAIAEKKRRQSEVDND